MKLTTVTTLTALFSADEIKAAALSLARKQAGLVDDAALASSAVTIQTDGSVQVDMVAAPPVDASKASQDAPAAPAFEAAVVPAAAQVPGFGGR